MITIEQLKIIKEALSEAILYVPYDPKETYTGHCIKCWTGDDEHDKGCPIKISLEIVEQELKERED